MAWLSFLHHTNWLLTLLLWGLLKNTFMSHYIIIRLLQTVWLHGPDVALHANVLMASSMWDPAVKIPANTHDPAGWQKRAALSETPRRSVQRQNNRPELDSALGTRQAHQGPWTGPDLSHMKIATARTQCCRNWKGIKTGAQESAIQDSMSLCCRNVNIKVWYRECWA